MKLRMPKPVYLAILGLFLVSFTFTACNNKSKKTEKTEKKDPNDTAGGHPVDGGNLNKP